jgi:hypothetical protein
MTMKKIVIITFIILFANLSFSQSTCDSLILLKKKTYDFKPSDFSDSVKDLKSAELDIFWNTAKRNRAEAAVCLNEMILNETHDSYFCFDASSLLLRLDTTGKYLPTVLKGIDKCDLEDLQLSPYLSICFYLGMKGYDISGLTNKLISIPNARVFLSDHFMTLNAIDASIFLYNAMPLKTAENALFEAIKNGNETAKHNASVILNLVSTERGDSLLNSLIENKQMPDSTIKFVEKDRKEFVMHCKGQTGRSKILEHLKDVPYNFEKEFYGFAGNDKLICSACNQLTIQDIELIREARRRSTPGISDEALYEYFALTRILMTVRAKNVTKK